MKKFKIIFLTIIFVVSIFSQTYSLENKILFKVNNDIITSLDILDELKYLETINKQFTHHFTCTYPWGVRNRGNKHERKNENKKKIDITECTLLLMFHIIY